MPTTITLVAHIGSDDVQLLPLVRAIDAQTLPYDAFEVVYVVDPGAAQSRRRLDELATRRPNVRVRDGADALATVLGDAAGEWVLYLSREVLGRRARLRARTLQQLTDFGAEHDCEIVVGRTDAGLVLHDAFGADVPRAGDLAGRALEASAAVACRRSFALEHGVPGDAEPAALIAATDRIGLVAALPSLIVSDETVTAAQAPAPSLTDASVEWRDSRVVVTVSGTAAGTPAGADVRFVVHRRGADARFWSATTTAATGTATVGVDGSFTATTEVDVRTAAAGEPLPKGVWQVRVGTQAAGAGWSAFAPVTGVALPPAVVEGTLVAAAPGRVLGIDVGANLAPVVPALDIATASITESAAGALLRVPLPGVHVSGEASIPGLVLLDTFRLRAELRTADGVATLHSRLSGMVGTTAISTRFGRSAPEPTGLSLKISPVGVMKIVPTPAGQAAPKATAVSGRPEQNHLVTGRPEPRPAAARPSAEGPSAVRPRADRPARAPQRGRARAPRLSQQVQQRVPEPLRPAVAALARNETARKVYRRLRAGR